MAQTKIKKELIDASFGTDWVETIQTSNFTAVAGKGYFVNTTSAEITVTLPAGVVGTEIVIQDYAGTFATNKVILNANGSEKIQGSTSNFRCVINNSTIKLIYQDATKGWTADNISLDTAPFTIDYLVVAGGGGGGGTYHGGGGGAGGYRNSFSNELSGGGQSSEAQLSLQTNTNYTATVGSGGSGGYSSNGINAQGSNGSNSVLSTIISIGGGGGGAYQQQPSSGGSGGGSSRQDSAVGTGAGALAVTSPVIQGYAGGNGSSSQTSYPGGGGGGAGSVGSNGTQGVGGNGGNGLASSITGSSIIRGGGGGATSHPSSDQQGSGGTGGGGNANYSAQGGDGATNTGGGGGGAERGGGFYSGGDGGSGVIIIRYPNTYTVTIGSGLTGATTTVGSDKVTTFTAGTGNISFS